jgi:hypothetical protein
VERSGTVGAKWNVSLFNNGVNPSPVERRTKRVLCKGCK